MTQPRLILASASPRRQDLLREAGYAITVQPADVDESLVPAGLSPGELADHLAARKAQAIARRFPHDVVLAADTVVAVGPAVFGKPADADDARRMLRQLSGTTQMVITGIMVIREAARFRRGRRVESSVHMRPLSAPEIEAYVATGDWVGKAGGYGIQDHDPFVTRITGSLTNIVGLPMDETAELLAEAGISRNKT